MRNVLIISFCLLLLSSISVELNAQTKRTKKTNKAKPTVAATPKPTPEKPAEIPAKRNERPTDEKPNNSSAASAPVYFYEYARPGFAYERILIEHDEAGKGKISFLKDGFDEMMTDPLDLSPVTLKNLKDAFTALDFLASNENYQTERDHSTMGSVEITVKKEGRARTAKYNWSDNKQAKFLSDEYRRVSNEYIWKFEMAVALQNQPLQTPSLMERMDSYVQRKEISDPPHLISLLNELSTDERLPLIARDRAVKIVKQIEKNRDRIN